MYLKSTFFKNGHGVLYYNDSFIPPHINNHNATKSTKRHHSMMCCLDNDDEEEDDDYNDYCDEDDNNTKKTEPSIKGDEDIFCLPDNNSSNNSISSSTSSSSLWETVTSLSDNGGNEGEYEDDLFIYIRDFPTQLICMEQCVDNIEYLLYNDLLSSDEMICALFQIIMTLCTYQKAFHYTHNDLHTNNIMYTNTDKQFIVYIFNEKMYKIPTFGKIYKIIDHGRSIYTFRGVHFANDSFAKNGDASTQYNYPPYYSPKLPTILPNYSFDLCRLACSLSPHNIICNTPDLENIVSQWCTDDYGNHVVNNDEADFTLYEDIAKDVHGHIPSEQLKKQLFGKYQINKITVNDENTICVNIDAIPVYI